MDELFGEQNFVEQLIWKKSYGGGAKEKYVVRQHEYCLLYALNKKNLKELWLPPDEASEGRYYKFRDEKFNERGPYRIKPLEATKSMDRRENLVFPIRTPDGSQIMPKRQWWWSRDRVEQSLARNELVFTTTKTGISVSYKQYLLDETGSKRCAKPFSVIDGIYTQQGTANLRELFDDKVVLQFPKPVKLIENMLYLLTQNDKSSFILDAFAGSGTTGHAVMALNKADGGNRRFILVEMDQNIARKVTAERLKRVAGGYTNAKGQKVEGLGGGFSFATLGEPLFDERGNIRSTVKFAELARHVHFIETGEPMAKQAKASSPLIGTYKRTAIYLLYNGILKDKSPDGGNVLTTSILAHLPKHDGPKVIYGTACRLGTERLRREQIIFKQLPYRLRVGAR